MRWANDRGGKLGAIGPLGRLLAGSGASGDDGACLDRFAAARDPSAFASLVDRHGAMVWATCRRMLADPHDAADAFQATFLVLARRAGAIRDPDRLGPWLHGVARRVAIRARASASRRRDVERSATRVDRRDEPDPDAFDTRAAIDEELARLPGRYRDVLVLCYLEGLTHDEAAARLHCPVGTVRSRLASGRDRLRSRLARRGLAPALTALLAPTVPPAAVAGLAVRVALAIAPPASVASLARGVLTMMLLGKIKAVAAGLAVSLAASGAVAVAQVQRNAGDPPKPAERAPTPNPVARLDSRFEPVEDPDRARLEALRREVRAIAAAIPKAEEQVRTLRADQAAGLAEIAQLERKLATSAPNPDAPAVANQPPPRVLPLPGSPNIVAVIPAALDRVTMIDTATQRRATFRLSKPATRIDIRANDSDNLTGRIPTTEDERRQLALVGLTLEGPEIGRVAVFDRDRMTWSERDLEQPVTAASPTMHQYSGLVAFTLTRPDQAEGLVFEAKEKTWTGQPLPPATPPGVVADVSVHGTVCFRSGRTLAIYSQVAKKWGTLELKSPQTGKAKNTVSHDDFRAGRLIVPEGDVLHIYDAKTGDWTHINTRDE